MEVLQGLPGPMNGDGEQSNMSVFSFFSSAINAPFWLAPIFYSYGTVATRVFSFIIS